MDRTDTFLTRIFQAKFDPLWIIGLGLLFFLPGLGQVHLFDWDEVNFAECAREMIASGNYLQVQINFEPFWEKPPLFFWMQVCSMNLFGVNEFAARFPNVICGITSLLFILEIGKRLVNRRFAWLWVLAYFGSILPHLYFRSGIIDPWFNLFIFSSIYCWHLVEDGQTRSLRFAITGGLLIGLGILTKGPVAALIAGTTILIYWIWKRFRRIPSGKSVLLYTLAALVAVASWFGIDWINNGPWFTETFIEYQIRLLRTEDAGHGGFPGYHFVVLLLGCFPASVFCLRGLVRPVQGLSAESESFQTWMRILFWFVLILFSLVQSKIIHYSSLCYFPLTFFAATQIESWLRAERSPPRLEKITLLVIGIVWVLACLALPVIGNNIDWIKPLAAADPFATANLEADINWSYITLIPGIFLGLILGWYYMTTTSFAQFRNLFLGMGLFTFLALAFFVGRIEGYSQRAIIEFYEEHAEEDAYFKPLGFKSYAHLFYAEVSPGLRAESKDQNWLISGDIDKPVYFISKIHRADRWNDQEGFERSGQRMASSYLDGTHKKRGVPRRVRHGNRGYSLQFISPKSSYSHIHLP